MGRIQLHVPTDLEMDLSNRHLETRAVWHKRARSGTRRGTWESPEYRGRMKLWERMPSQSVSIEKSCKEVILENINSVEATEEEEQPSLPATPPTPQNTKKDKQEKNLKTELSWKPREERISRTEFQAC